MEWRIEARTFHDAVSCRGTTTFLDGGANATRVVLAGDLSLARSAGAASPTPTPGASDHDDADRETTTMGPNARSVTKDGADDGFVVEAGYQTEMTPDGPTRCRSSSSPRPTPR